MRLLNNTPPKIAFEKLRNRPQETWLSMKKDLQNIGLTWENAIELTENIGQCMKVCNNSVFYVTLSNIVFTNTYYVYVISNAKNLPY